MQHDMQGDHETCSHGVSVNMSCQECESALAFVNPYSLLTELKEGFEHRYICKPSTQDLGTAKLLKKCRTGKELARAAYEHDEDEDGCKRYSKFTTYREIQLDFVHFLKGDKARKEQLEEGECLVCGLPRHRKPPNAETELIARQLCELVEHQPFLTWDSQPGLYIDEEEPRVQRPYLFLSGPPGAVKALLKCLAAVKLNGRNPICLADKEFYEELVHQHRENQFMSPAPLLASLVPQPLSKTLEGHLYVCLVCQPDFWWMPFFTTIYDAAFGKALDAETLLKNSHLF